MGLFKNQETEEELNKLRREVVYLKAENQKINEKKSLLEHNILISDGVFLKEDALNNIMLKQNKTRNLRLKDMRNNLSDVLKVAGELINYIQFMQKSFDQVSEEVNKLSSKNTQAEKLSNSAKKIYQVLELKSQEIQMALTEVADNAYQTRHIAKDAALKAAKMGQFAHEFADIVGNIKDSSDKAQINAKRAKGAFSRFTESMDSEFSDQGKVEWLTEASKDIGVILEKIGEETETKLENISCMVDKASNGLRKIDSEIFINQIYLTMNSENKITKANPGLFDASTTVSVYERHIHEDAKRVADIIGEAPASLKMLKTVFVQIERNSLELFSSIDKENQVEDKALDARTIMNPIEELACVDVERPNEEGAAFVGPLKEIQYRSNKHK
jgi:methyl-accepting chemotaxis protein